MNEYPRCPNPECVFGKNHDIRPGLEPIEFNVHGAGFAHMYCRSCNREYYVFYRVDRIARIDPDTGEEIA